MQNDRNVGMQGNPTENEFSMMREIESLFDTEFYLSIYDDVARDGIDPLLHYVRYGLQEGRQPNKESYLSSLRGEGLEVVGTDSGSLLNSSECRVSSASENSDNEVNNNMINSELYKAIEKEFDPIFYTNKYPDIKMSGINPLIHYIDMGWQELRNPNSEFDTSYYLKSNPDVQQAEINPFWHFLVAGRQEGRLPSHPGGWKAATLDALPTLEEQVEAWSKSTKPSVLLTYTKLRDILLVKFSEQSWNIIVSLSHDNYRANAGGVQLCLQMEANTAVSDDYVYLNLFPYQPLPKMSDNDDPEDFIVGVILNNHVYGFARFKTVICVLEDIKKIGARFNIIVHSILGHNVDLIIALFRSAGCVSGIMWSHDYTLLCSNHALQRNSISFCSAPGLGSVACRVCHHGSERIVHLNALKRLFSCIDFTVISPSENTKEFLLEKCNLPISSIEVVPHMHIGFSELPPSDNTIKGKIKVGYIGYKAPHKGWPLFVEIVKRLHHGNIYDFHYFGVDQNEELGITNHYVHVNLDNPMIMIDALINENIDLVIHWSSARETFSFSAHEAISAGCHIITSSTSGNVAHVVKKYDKGKVLDSADEVINYFELGHAVKLAHSARVSRASQRCLVEYSQFSLTFLNKGY